MSSVGCLSARLTFLLFAASVCLAAPVSASDKLELRLRLKKGEVYRLKLTVDQHVEQGAGQTTGGETRRPRGGADGGSSAPPLKAQTVDQTLTVGYTMSVDDVDAGGAMTVTTTYDSVVLRQKGPAGVVEYDSANPPKQPAPAARAFAVLQGLSFKMTVAPAGTVNSVEGVDEMLAEVVRRLSLPEGPERRNVQKVLSEQFGDAAMKQNMQDLFALYPPRPVAVGESWDHKVVVSRGFPVVIEGAYTLRGRTGGVAEIALKDKLSPNTTAGPVELGTGKMTYELTGRQHGTARVDEETGWTQSLVTEQELSGTIRFRTSGNTETTIPVTVKSKVTMEPVK